MCGLNIPKFFNHTAIQPFGKKKDWVHKNCFENFITFNDAKSKLDEKSRLICHVEPAFSKSPSNVCRMRVVNNSSIMYLHLNNSHKNDNLDIELDEAFESIRKKYFLKPNGKPFVR